MKKIIFVVSVALFSGIAWAQTEQCKDVIALSKTKATYTESKESVKQAASDFCREYEKSQSERNKIKLEADYKLLSASTEGVQESMQEVSDNYCSKTDSSMAKSDSYERYVETIAPGAYSSYNECIKAANYGLKFDVDPNAILAKVFSISVSFNPKNREEIATLIYSAADDITCNWDGQLENESKHVLTGPSTALLKCNRENADKQSYVKIANTTSSGDSQLTLPWYAHTDEGIPVIPLNETNIKVRDNKKEIGELNDRISGLVSDVNPLLLRPKVMKANLGLKARNNGTVDCKKYCSDSYEDFYGTCKAVLDYRGNYQNCDFNPQGRPMQCICTIEGLICFDPSSQAEP
uniref:Uncharacterized protein n=1 Tax=Candidatus Kentrum sp. FW TaxID=2126338 RepID=A0A450U4N6_9GAMM|nr:MAG: hypothetical protein BECKFW1821C_GA0114237_12033 [Candidatus Kentron sp. FW]